MRFLKKKKRKKMSSKRERPEGEEEKSEEAKQQCLGSEYKPTFITVAEYAEKNPKEVTLLHVISQNDEEREIFSEHVYMLAENLATFFLLVKKHSTADFLFHLITDEIMYQNLHKIRDSSEEELQDLFPKHCYWEYEESVRKIKKFLKTLPEDHSFLNNLIIKKDLMGERLRFRNERKEQLVFTGFTTYIFFDRAL